MWIALVLAAGLWIIHPVAHNHGHAGDPHPHCALNSHGTTPTPTQVAPPVIEPVIEPVIVVSRPCDQAPFRRIDSFNACAPRAPPAV